MRVYVRKILTGAIYSSVMPNSGVWRKESLGFLIKPDTQQVGTVTQNFFPLNRRNKKRFEVLS